MLPYCMPVLQVLANLLYPPACLLCHASLQPLHGCSGAPDDASRGLLCEGCRSAIIRSRPPVCLCCGVTLPGAYDAAVRCGACRSSPPIFEKARAPWQYAGPMKEAIRQFKYHRRWRLGRWVAQTMIATARASFPLDEIDAVVPVPLHGLKRRFKGFNPAEHLAAPLAKWLRAPCLPGALRRIRWTASQTRLTETERIRNVRAAFAARRRALRGGAVLLVDDVLTSGATANACAAALKAAGVPHVFVLTAARTPLL